MFSPLERTIGRLTPHVSIGRRAALDFGSALLPGLRDVGPSEGGLLELADHLVEAGVRLFPISDDPPLLAKAASCHSLSLVAVLAGVPESLSPVVSVIPGQLVALFLADRRGGNLDQPRALSKVTRTE